MKTTITPLMLLCFTFFTWGQNKEFSLLEEHTQTKILYDNVIGLSKIATKKKECITSAYFKQVYHEIQRADFLNRLPQYETLKTKAKNAKISNQIPLAILISDFESIKPESFSDNTLQKNDANQFTIDSSNKPIFNKHSIAFLAPLASKTNSHQTTFILNSDAVYNTTQQSITSIRIKTDNSEWKEITLNIPFTIHLNQSGNQIVQFEIELSTGQVFSNQFKIDIPLNKNAQRATMAQTISATIPFQGFGESQSILGQGDYEIYLDNVNQVLDKPIFLIDGFDPGDSRNTTMIYESLNYGNSGENLGDLVRNEGYDIIVLNFPTYTSGSQLIDGGADFIERNAMVLASLITQINNTKVGNEQNVIIGPSMGGLISRYALRYMEQNDQNHQTRLYISFDSPHLGANVPIGFQHLFNYLAYGPTGDVTIQDLVDGVLRSPAAKQMLLDHFDGHLSSTDPTAFNPNITLPTGAPNYRNAFQTQLNTMGFPQNTRNISISNGSNNGTLTGTQGMDVMNFTYNLSESQRAIINLKFTPAAGNTNQVSRFRGQQSIFGTWITLLESIANSQTATGSAGLDSAPGGTFNIEGFTDETGNNDMLTEFLDNLLIDKFSFIPTLSSLAISDTPNWNTIVTNASTTPFAATYVPTTNEPHVTLTASNVAFVLNEILNPPLSTVHPINSQLWVQNPMQEQLTVQTSQPIEGVHLQLFDIHGRIMLSQNNITIHQDWQVPITLEKGIYLLQMSNQEFNHTQKLIKN
jgi:pimeloyl-ACP methyl ester carboxylesterase